MYDNLGEDDRVIIYLDFSRTLNKIKEDYMDVYEGVESKILFTRRFNENPDLRITYFDQENMIIKDRLKEEEWFSITEGDYITGKYSDDTEHQIFLNTGEKKIHYVQNIFFEVHILICIT